MRYLWIYLILIVLAACSGRNTNDSSGNDTEISIKGKLENGADQLVTIDLMDPNQFIPVDSVRCDENGNFTLQFEGSGIDFYALKYTEYGYVTLIAGPGDKITISGTADQLYPYEIKGSPSSSLVEDLGVHHKQILNELISINEETRKWLGAPDFETKKLALNNRFDSITEAFHQFSKDFIYKHTDSPAILVALYYQYGPGLPVFDPLKDFETYQFVDSVLYTQFPENKAIKSLHSQVNAAVQVIKNQQQEQGLQTGMKAPDFVMETSEGNRISLRELRGKYVLLQFWAVWSKPSSEENPYLKKCYDTFSKSDFTILQISLDNDKEEWINAIREQDLSWTHVSDLNRWDSPVVDLYKIDRIPANFIIDPEGIIVRKDLFGSDLIDSLSSILKH